MKIFKFLLIAGLAFYGMYWFATSGVAWWQQRKITSAVERYHEETSYYPVRLRELTSKTYTNEDGNSKTYLNDIPIPRDGYCWEYSKQDGSVRLKPLPEGADRDIRVCP